MATRPEQTKSNKKTSDAVGGLFHLHSGDMVLKWGQTQEGKQVWKMHKRVLLAQFKHETNSYSPIPADLQAFRNFACRFGADVLQAHSGITDELGGFIEVFQSYPDFELVPSFELVTEPSAAVTSEVYELAESTIRRSLEEQGPFDGVLLALHGAMVAEGHPDAEGDFVALLREIVGDAVPIVVTLDLHGNITRKMADNASALVAYEKYPHTDSYATGKLGATILAETLRGRLNPQLGYRYVPYLLPLFPSEFPEIKKFHDMARAYEMRPGVCCVRVCHGFFPSNVDEMGMSVLVVTDGDKAQAQEIADELGRAIWEGRETLKRKYMALDEALDIVEKAAEGPIVLADASDNPGAGGMGETTHILRRILERGICGGAVVMICDPESVKACMAAGVGNRVQLRLGALYDPAYSGEPLEVEGLVEHLSHGKYRNHGVMSRGMLFDIGKAATVNIGGNHVIITTLRTQPYDMEVMRCCGLDPEEQRFIVVKSSVHFRAHYGTVAKQILDLAVPGYAVPLPDGYSYTHWKNASEKK
ncbi:MAG: M81 family metallopeptidase [Ruminococcaceae bacterium]|nr:M81 family metallopeptidase [Oscillospiraceae bacterium]